MSEDPPSDPDQLMHSQTPSMPSDAQDPVLSMEDQARLFTQQDSIDAAKRLFESQYQATHDDLTGDLNLRGLKEKLGDNHVRRAVAFVDADNFKEVNDKLGHARGDEVLIGMSKIINASFRPGDLIARIGGDEFFIVLEEDVRPDHSAEHGSHEDLAESALEAGRKRMTHGVFRFLEDNLDLQALHLALTSGGTVWEPGETFEEVKARADGIMLANKVEQHREFQYRQSPFSNLGGYQPKQALEKHSPAHADYTPKHENPQD